MKKAKKVKQPPAPRRNKRDLKRERDLKRALAEDTETVNLDATAKFCGIQRKTLLQRLAKKGHEIPPDATHARIPLCHVMASASVRTLVRRTAEFRRSPVKKSVMGECCDGSR